MDVQILIVDDEMIMRESLAGWLERDGHYAETSPSGEEALEKLKQTRFDILLVDIKMEGMSGLELQEQLNRLDYHPPIIMISGHGEITMAVNAVKSGAIDFLQKPVSDQLLLERISQALKKNQEAL